MNIHSKATRDPARLSLLTLSAPFAGALGLAAAVSSSRWVATLGRLLVQSWHEVSGAAMFYGLLAGVSATSVVLFLRVLSDSWKFAYFLQAATQVMNSLPTRLQAEFVSDFRRILGTSVQKLSRQDPRRKKGLFLYLAIGMWSGLVALHSELAAALGQAATPTAGYLAAVTVAVAGTLAVAWVHMARLHQDSALWEELGFDDASAYASRAANFALQGPSWARARDFETAATSMLIASCIIGSVTLVWGLGASTLLASCALSSWVVVLVADKR